MGAFEVVQVLTLRSALGVAVLTVVAALVALPGIARFRRRLARAARGPDAAELGLRTVSGRLPGVHRRWRTGVGVLDGSGSLSWERQEVQLRLWLLDTPVRRPRWYEVSVINPGASIHAVTTGTGWTGEVAVLPQDAGLLHHLPSFPGGAAGMPDLGGLNGTGGVARQ